MAKTNFPNSAPYEVMVPDFANSIYGQGADGGHKHDGVDDDGHCSKIDLSAHVQNRLALSNMRPPYNYKSGFDMSVSESGLIIHAGSCADSTGEYWIHSTGGALQIINSEQDGYGSDFVASGVGAITDGKWLYIFALINISTGVVTLRADDDINAANLIGGDDNIRHRRLRMVRIQEDGGIFTITKMHMHGPWMYFPTLMHTETFGPSYPIDSWSLIPVGAPPDLTVTAKLKILSLDAANAKYFNHGHIPSAELVLGMITVRSGELKEESVVAEQGNIWAYHDETDGECGVSTIAIEDPIDS